MHSRMHLENKMPRNAFPSESIKASATVVGAWAIKAPSHLG